MRRVFWGALLGNHGALSMKGVRATEGIACDGKEAPRDGNWAKSVWWFDATAAERSSGGLQIPHFPLQLHGPPHAGLTRARESRDRVPPAEGVNASIVREHEFIGVLRKARDRGGLKLCFPRAPEPRRNKLHCLTGARAWRMWAWGFDVQARCRARGVQRDPVTVFSAPQHPTQRGGGCAVWFRPAWGLIRFMPPDLVCSRFQHCFAQLIESKAIYVHAHSRPPSPLPLDGRQRSHRPRLKRLQITRLRRQHRAPILIAPSPVLAPDKRPVRPVRRQPSIVAALHPPVHRRGVLVVERARPVGGALRVAI